MTIFFWTTSNAEEKRYPVYVAQGDWHTGLILAVQDIPIDVFPEVKGYDTFNYLDIGWGDLHYYMANGGNISLALNAILHPTPSVILIMPYKSHPKIIYGDHSKLVKLELDEHQYQKLCRFVAKSFARDKNGDPLSAAEPDFYLAKRKYHLLRTCNTWVAMALKNAGLKVRSFPVIMEWQLFSQLEKLDIDP